MEQRNPFRDHPGQVRNSDVSSASLYCDWAVWHKRMWLHATREPVASVPRQGLRSAFLGRDSLDE